MSCLTLNPTSVNNHNAQYAHKHAIFHTTGCLQRGRHNGRRTTGKMMQTAKCPFAKNRHAQKYCFAKIWFPQGYVCENPGYPGPWFAKDQGQIFLKRCFYPCFAKNRHAQKYVLRKSVFPKDVFAKILDIQDRGLRKIRVRSFSKDVFTHVLRKTAMPKNMFCENLVSPRMCSRKSWISRTVVCERSGSDLSQKICNC